MNRMLIASLIVLATCSLAAQKELSFQRNGGIPNEQIRFQAFPPGRTASSEVTVDHDHVNHTLGQVTRDLTGDGIPETLTLTGDGRTIGDLSVTLTIRAPGRLLYTQAWRLTLDGFDSRRRVSDAELEARLADYSRSFFADSQFMSPTRFLSWLQASARLHIPLIPDVIASQMTQRDSARAQLVWQQMQAGPITLFSFSPGGDRVMMIGWSAADQRFYNLLECC